MRMPSAAARRARFGFDVFEPCWWAIAAVSQVFAESVAADSALAVAPSGDDFVVVAEAATGDDV
ncbi:hypothetical protein HMPREF9120_00232 [Neisseria sp. oral taxon 020 str. F0370]|nr:hypothetical protein CGZ77_10750 [Neisseria sp. KEM232]EKY09864.1 hypothetical protein HMPREF9120_00232 [Neisseria sp. oral taxon 020 str. F0370]